MDSNAKANGIAHPHDLLVRNILFEEDLAADFLRNYLNPDWVALLDLEQIKCEPPSAVDKNLVETLADLRYSTFFKGSRRQLRVFVFLEHQSTPDRFISLRLLEYVCRAYRQHLSSTDTKKGMKTTLPYPLAVVLHHGKKAWGNVVPMRELIDTVPEAELDILKMPICLVDLPGIPEGQLRGHPTVQALLNCLQSASMGTLATRFEDIAAGLAEIKNDSRSRAWLTAFVKYTMSQCHLKNGMETISRVLGKIYRKKEADEMALTLADELKLEGKKEGKAEGKADGVMTVLKARFGEIPAALGKKLRSLRDPERLDKALELAATCETLAEFKKTYAEYIVKS